MPKTLFWLVLALMPALSAAGEKKERWIYLPANFQVDAEVSRVSALLERASTAGFTHALLQDSKFAHIESVSSAYRPNVAKVKAIASRLHIELVPAAFPVGYSNDLLFRDPNLAEGLPVKDAIFEVKGDLATLVPDPPVSLPPTSSKAGWDFVDDSLAVEGDGLRSEATSANARLHKKLEVSPFRQYHLSAMIRTAGFSGGRPEIKVLGKGGRSLQWTNLSVKPDQDFTRHDVTFNSLENTGLSIYFGVWGGHSGTLWWQGARVEECGPVNMLRREGAPLVIKRGNGDLLQEGKDFEPFMDPLMGSTPWPGSYTAWHEPPVLRIPAARDGEKLRVSYFHTHIIHDEQVCGCVEEPAFQGHLREGAKDVVSLWGAKAHFMNHDEWRLMGWDESCRKSGKTPARIAADNLRLCAGILRNEVPGGPILVWNDMFDPFHNAVKDYYLVNGSLEGSWDGLSPDIQVMNWNFGKRVESLAFFATRGNPQLIAGYYDGNLADVDAWLASAEKVNGVKGFMYTTWKQDYSKLEEVAAKLEAAGW